MYSNSTRIQPKRQAPTAPCPAGSRGKPRGPDAWMRMPAPTLPAFVCTPFPASPLPKHRELHERMGRPPPLQTPFARHRPWPGFPAGQGRQGTAAVPTQRKSLQWRGSQGRHRVGAQFRPALRLLPSRGCAGLCPLQAGDANVLTILSRSSGRPPSPRTSARHLCKSAGGKPGPIIRRARPGFSVLLVPWHGFFQLLSLCGVARATWFAAAVAVSSSIPPEASKTRGSPRNGIRGGSTVPR